jgi:hypothetical protein
MGATAEAITVEVLLDNEHSRIEWHRPAGGEPRPLLITFDPLLYLWPKPAFGLDFLLRQGVQVVAVRRKAEHFYQPLSRQAFMAAVAPALALHTRVIAYGSSLGAYAAMYYARDLDAEVISLSPRVSVHPVFGSPAWQQLVAFQHEVFSLEPRPRCRAVVVFDPREANDRRFIDEGLRPHFPAADFVALPFAGHPATQFLGDIGHLAPWICNLVAASPAPVLDRRAGRRRSASYYQVMADLCARRGRLALAEVLVERSLALRQRNMLAQRTRGLIKLLQRDWPQAMASLESALAMEPADPLTQSMLTRARNGLNLRPAQAVPVVADAPTTEPLAPAVPRWRRYARRLRHMLRG